MDLLNKIRKVPETGRKLEALRNLHIRVSHTCVDAFVGSGCKTQALHYTATNFELSDTFFFFAAAAAQFWCYVIFILVIGS